MVHIALALGGDGYASMQSIACRQGCLMMQADTAAAHSCRHAWLIGIAVEGRKLARATNEERPVSCGGGSEGDACHLVRLYIGWALIVLHTVASSDGHHTSWRMTGALVAGQTGTCLWRQDPTARVKPCEWTQPEPPRQASVSGLLCASRPSNTHPGVLSFHEAGQVGPAAHLGVFSLHEARLQRGHVRRPGQLQQVPFAGLNG